MCVQSSYIIFLLICCLAVHMKTHTHTQGMKRRSGRWREFLERDVSLFLVNATEGKAASILKEVCARALVFEC